MINASIQELWKSLFSFENPIGCIIEIRRMSQIELLTISSEHASFLTSLYTEEYSDYPQELRTQTSLLISSLFSQNLDLVPLFDKFGLFSLVYPLFPNYKISSFLHFYAERSFKCARYLIENGFVSTLINVLSSSLQQIVNDPDENNQVDERSERIDNFLDYVLCAGSVCDFSQFEHELLPLGAVLNSIILNVDDWKIQCEAINSLSTLLRNIESAAKAFLLSDSFFLIISPEKCQSNISYLKSIINLFGSLLRYTEILNDRFYETSMKIFSSSINLLKDKCGKNESSESCVKLIANAVADGCSENNPNFTKICFKYGIIQSFFEIFYDDNPWNLKINLFEAILKLFSFGLPDSNSLKAFLDLGFLDFFVNNISEMCCCNGFAISLTLNSLLTFVNNSNDNDNSLLIDTLTSEEVEEALDILLQSDDSEIKYTAQKAESLIHDLVV